MTAPKLDDEPKKKPVFDRDAMRANQAATATRTWADPAVRARRSAAIAEGHRKKKLQEPVAARCARGEHPFLERVERTNWMRCPFCGEML